MANIVDTGASRFPIPSLRPTEPTGFMLGSVGLTRRTQYDTARQKEQQDRLPVHFHPPLEAGKQQEHVDISVATKDLILPKEGTKEYGLVSRYLRKLGVEGLAVPTTAETAAPYIKAVLEKSGLKDSSRETETDGNGPIISVLFGGQFEAVTWDDKRRQEFMRNISAIDSPDDCGSVVSRVEGENVEIHTHGAFSTRSKKLGNKLGVLGLALVHNPSREFLGAILAPELIANTTGSENQDVLDKFYAKEFKNIMANPTEKDAYFAKLDEHIPRLISQYQPQS